MQRRLFLRDGSLLLLSGAAMLETSSQVIADSEDPAVVRFGLITDLHYADKEPSGSRHYRASIAKLQQAAKQFNETQPDFLVELGDLIDAAADVPTEMKYLSRISKEMAMIQAPKHYVLGNHCVDTLTKKEFLGGVGQEKSFYSFDRGGYHFVILDACFRSDGTPYQRKNFQWTDPNIAAHELKRLKTDLAATAKKTIVFVHQRLDDAGVHGVRNAAAVRKIMEDSGQVLAVFQGHSHQNEHQEIGGIHYCTMVAMVEESFEVSNGYSTASVLKNGTIRITGFRKQNSYTWNSKG